MKKVEIKDYPKILTHDDDFHVDEVFAIALLGVLGFDAKNMNDLVIQRTRKNEIIEIYRNSSEESYIIDLGLEYDENHLRFDHHQNDANLKWAENEKLPEVDYKGRSFLYSSCGLIWKYLLGNQEKFPKVSALSESKKDKITHCVKWVDICDNGIKPWFFAPLIFSYNQASQGKSNEEVYFDFRKAVEEAANFINNIVNCEEIDVKNIYKENININNNETDEILLNLSAKKLKGLNQKEIECFESYIFSKYYKLLSIHIHAFNLGKNKELKKSLSNLMDNFLKIAKKEVLANIEIKKALKEAKDEGRKDILMFENDNHNARQLTSELSEDGLLCATYYKEKDQWSITLINEKREDPYKGRIDMPLEWAGFSGEELSRVSGFPNMIFAHKGRFIVVMKGTKEECINVCNKILDLTS